MNHKNIYQLNKALKEAESYPEWQKFARLHDEESGMDAWRSKESSKLYDNEEIRLRLDTLRDLRQKGDDEGLLFTLNEGIHGNMGGMGQSVLYNRALSGTKYLITDYIDEVANALLHLADENNTKIALPNKLDFFHRASICFGRSALMLSGGGQLGNFHFGVLKALVKANLLPRVISGASAGSIFAALVGTTTDEELEKIIENQIFKDTIQEEAILYEHMVEGKKASVKDLQTIIQSVIPDLTFHEAFEKTGRKINIPIAPQSAHQKSRLLNAVASPNVLIHSAVMASCAIPGIMPPVTLYAKNRNGEVQPYLPSRKWVDGSMANDLPSKRLTRLYGINHFIVSLTNPLVLPFIKDPSQQNRLFEPVRKLSTSLLKETTQFNYSIAKRFFKYFPKKVTFTANAINSIVQQDYIGDINIFADFNILKASKVLATWTPEELKAIIDQGEKATWPKLEAIRVTTKIGRILDEILEQYEHLTHPQQELMVKP